MGCEFKADFNESSDAKMIAFLEYTSVFPQSLPALLLTLLPTRENLNWCKTERRSEEITSAYHASASYERKHLMGQPRYQLMGATKPGYTEHYHVK